MSDSTSQQVVTRQAFEAWRAGGAPPSEIAEILGELVADASQAMARPVLSVAMYVGSAAETLDHRFVMDDDALVGFLDTGADSGIVITDMPPALPHILAELTDLGPMPTLSGTCRVDLEVVDRALSSVQLPSDPADVEALATAVAGVWPEAASALRGGEWLMWTAGTVWSLEGRSPDASVTTVLTTPSGAVLVTPCEEGLLELVGLNATNVWTALIGLMAEEQQG